MSEPAKHTPGPWTFGSEWGTDIYRETYRQGPMIADVPQVNAMPDDEWRANRSLINAAPELLEALKTLRSDSALGMGTKWVRACEQADAAIAKAEGRAAE